MLYTYVRPDFSNCRTGHMASAQLSEQELAARIERRRIPRAIPVPHVIECSDTEAWSLWDQTLES